jgi:hypothetical protein
MDVKGSRRVSRSVRGRQPEQGVGKCGVAGAKGLDPVADHSLRARSARMGAEGDRGHANSAVGLDGAIRPGT